MADGKSSAKLDDKVKAGTAVVKGNKVSVALEDDAKHDIDNAVLDAGDGTIDQLDALLHDESSLRSNTALTLKTGQDVTLTRDIEREASLTLQANHLDLRANAKSSGGKLQMVAEHGATLAANKRLEGESGATLMALEGDVDMGVNSRVAAANGDALVGALEGKLTMHAGSSIEARGDATALARDDLTMERGASVKANEGKAVVASLEANVTTSGAKIHGGTAAHVSAAGQNRMRLVCFFCCLFPTWLSTP
jgi:hypothetical protein